MSGGRKQEASPNRKEQAMRRMIVAATLAALMTVAAVPALAQEVVVVDTGNGTCTQDGVPGFLSGSVDDYGCITPAEYEVIFGIPNLIEVGVIDSAVLNDDGTATVEHSLGGSSVIEADPWERPVAATPSLEPDAPTVREFWQRAGVMQPV